MVSAEVQGERAWLCWSAPREASGRRGDVDTDASSGAAGRGLAAWSVWEEDRRTHSWSLCGVVLVAVADDDGRAGDEETAWCDGARSAARRSSSKAWLGVLEWWLGCSW